MNQKQIIEVVADLAPKAQSQLSACNDIDEQLSSRALLSLMEKQGFHTRKTDLKRLSRSPILRLIVEQMAQQVVVEAISSTDGNDTTEHWRSWDTNGMPSRQYSLFDAAFRYGESYTLMSPGRAEGEERAIIRAYSPRRLYVVWADDDNAQYPLYGLVRRETKGRETLWELVDEEASYWVGSDESGAFFYIDEYLHDIGQVPIVRFNNTLPIDFDQRSEGEPERYGVVSDRYEKTTHDRLLIQHNNSWRVIVATGLEEPGSTEEENRLKAKFRHDDVLLAGEGVDFKSLPETMLDGMIRAAEADQEMLAAISQTPLWALNGGKMVNLSADALVESRAMARQKIQQRKRINGRSVCATLRLTAHIEGRAEDAADYSLTTIWEDLESQAMSAAADALGKIATTLEVPPQLLWDLIPGISKTRADQWRKDAQEFPTDANRLVDVVDRHLRG